MEVCELALKGVKLIKPLLFSDDRGFFFESYSFNKYKKHGISTSFVQDNHSFSFQGTIRGMHYQSGPGQAKLVRVGFGKIFDVIVDIKENSPTFGQWIGVNLDSKNHHQVFIPEGFAHGFCVISEYAHVFYKTSTHYSKDLEKGFCYDDPAVGIKWPLKFPITSRRDKNAPLLEGAL